MSIGAFASSGEEVNTEKDVTCVEQVCCYRTVTLGYFGPGGTQVVTGYGSGCVESTDFPEQDMADACAIAVANANRDARSKIKKISETP